MERIPDHAGAEPPGSPVEVRDFAVWRGKDGKAAEILTTQNQLSSLNQISHLPEEVYAAWRMIGAGGRESSGGELTCLKKLLSRGVPR
jgi:hypothetical protein